MTLEMENVHKAYGENIAVNRISLEIKKGEIFGLLGPNGAGKTTTLKIISGLVLPDGGVIRISGIDISLDPDGARSRIAYVPDEPSLYPKLSGREFLYFAGKLRRIDSVTLNEGISFHEKLFDMKGWLDQRAESYSHGMTQRIVLSSAFIAKPVLYVIDEPLVGLDPPSAETFYCMTRAATQSGAAVVLSTHTLPVAYNLCDRIGILNEGELVSVLNVSTLAEGELKEIFFRVTGSSPAEVEGYFT